MRTLIGHGYRDNFKEKPKKNYPNLSHRFNGYSILRLRQVNLNCFSGHKNRAFYSTLITCNTEIFKGKSIEFWINRCFRESSLTNYKTSSALRFRPDSYVFAFFEIAQVYLRFADHRAQSYLQNERATKPFRKHPKRSKFVCIKSSLFVEIPRYLEIPLIDFCETSHSRRQSSKEYYFVPNLALSGITRIPDGGREIGGSPDFEQLTFDILKFQHDSESFQNFYCDVIPTPRDIIASWKKTTVVLTFSDVLHALLFNR